MRALKSMKKVRMLSSWANYLLGSNISGAQDSRGWSNNETPESAPVMARLSQVEVEGDDWILIDRAVEGATTLEESWYVMPPACFTRESPVNVETSPLEDLLIEHPSMSVYRATASPVALDTPPPTPKAPKVSKALKAPKALKVPEVPKASEAPEARDLEENVLPDVEENTQADVVPEAPIAATEAAPPTPPTLERNPRRRDEEQQATTRRPARSSIHKIIVQLRSAQKVLEKKSTQALKRGRLERSNKLREVFSVKGKRPRRQDRLRIQNSGANNNRKC